MITAALDGFLLGGSLIVAIGAQNAFVIRQGLSARHVIWICLFCAVSDTMLIIAGVFGLSAVAAVVPLAVPIMTYGGAAYLFYFGTVALRRALRPLANVIEQAEAQSLKTALLMCAGFTFLNPHVYLDTVILVGSVANTHEGEARYAFAAGAALSSFVWFFSIGLGAMALKPWLDNPRVWQIIDSLIALILFGLCGKLLWGLYSA